MAARLEDEVIDASIYNKMWPVKRQFCRNGLSD
jgi:hypothetical protein